MTEPGPGASRSHVLRHGASPGESFGAPPGRGWPPALRAELEAVYDAVDRELEATGVVCRARGICCDFDRSPHVLYASSIETAHVRELHPDPFPGDSNLCPFWVGGLCGLRERRPLGCRTYYCDERFRDTLEAIHEKYHGRIRAIADRHGVPWSYRPFVAVLRGR